MEEDSHSRHQEQQDDERNNEAVTVDFDYEYFLRTMRHPACRPLINMARQFITRFQSLATPLTPPDQLVHLYRDFLDTHNQAVRQNPVWRLRGDKDEGEYEVAREGMEYLLMNQLYPVAFHLPSDRERNRVVERNMFVYGQWIEKEHLDIRTYLDDEALQQAIESFKRLNEYLTPRDKLVALLTAVKMIQNMVEMGGKEVTADDMIPLLIFSLLKAQVPRLYSNLQYISRFRDPRVLSDKNAYHLTSVMAAVTFVEGLDKEALIIEDSQYAENMQSALEKYSIEHNASTLTSPTQESRDFSTNTAAASRSSPTSEFTEEAGKIFASVKEKVKLGASKSIDFFGKLMDEAEMTLRGDVSSDGRGGEFVNNINVSNHHSNPLDERERSAVMADEEEYQMQLAMALSLSEQEYNVKHPLNNTADNSPQEIILVDTTNVEENGSDHIEMS